MSTKLFTKKNPIIKLFEHKNNTLFVWNNDENQSINYVSKNIEEILGYSDADFYENHITYIQCIHPDSINQVKEELDNFLKNKEDFLEHKPYKIIAKDKKEKWILQQTVSQKDEDGNITHLISHISNIHSAKESQVELLRNQKNKFDTATRSANLGVWSLNLENDELDWDEIMYSIYEAKDRVSFKNWLNHVHPDDRMNALEKVQNAVKNNSHFSDVFKIVTPTNEIKYIEATGMLYSQSDKPSYMIGTNRDITDTVKLKKELTETYAKLSGLFNLSPIGIALNDMDGKFIEVNDAFTEITSYSKEELNNLDYWALTPKKYIEAEKRELKILKEKKVYGPYEKEYIQKNGNLIPVNLNGMIIQLNNQPYIWSLVENISQRKEHDRVLIEQKILQQEKIIIEQSKMASMGLMIGNIAHQWKQPLATIGAINAKLRISQELDMLDDEQLNNSLSKQDEQIAYLSNVISTFNEYFAPKSYKEQKIILQNNINASLSIVSVSLKEHQIIVVNEADNEDLIEIETIPNELNEVLISIFNNAKDALIENNIKEKKILIDVQKTEDIIQITIEDNAGGVKEDIISQIFEPYFTTKHKAQGTGLGLHICYNIIVKNLGGTIYVKNTEKGAKFYIELPTEWGGGEI